MKSTESRALRGEVEAFLDERLGAKLEKLKTDDPKREAIQQQHQRETWVADAARRVAQLQVVTHSLKPIHPDAKGTNLYRPPSELPEHPEIGTHILGANIHEDVVGNAAALDVYKLLKLEHEGQTLLSRALTGDDELAAAFSENVDQGREWMKAFAGITQARGTATTHARAKQVYWLAGEDPTENTDFHLLAPLYATSLTHTVHQAVNEHRFSEEAKAARKARREKKYSQHGYCEYPNLSVQKLGGTKPQNISQLNSERRGNNYLLASLPPNWASRDVVPPLHITTIFPNRFGRRAGTRQTLSALRHFLAASPPANLETRRGRDEYIQTLIDELLLFGSELQSLEPGWSAKPECRLNQAEALWLDARRSEIDMEFSVQRQNGDWVDEVSHRFGNWLNAQLDRNFPVGDAEHREWMDSLREVLPYV